VLWVPEVGISQALQVSPKRPPSHSWMIGDMVDLEQLKTLKFLFEELSNAATAEIAEQAENADATTPADDDEVDSLTVEIAETSNHEQAFSAIKAPYQETKPKPWVKNDSTLEAEARAFLEEDEENTPADPTEADFVERRRNPNRYGKLDEASFELDELTDEETD
jgi:hypothetical protein